MALVTGVTLPNNGDRIKVENYNDPLTKILAQVNGNLDGANVGTGTLPWEAMASFTDKIPSTAMQDSASLEKFREEAAISFIASGCEWSILSGLNGQATAGIMYNHLGVRTAVALVVSRTFTASKDTWVSVSNGSYTYTEVANGAARPSLPANSVWVSKVVTSGAAITSVVSSRKLGFVGSANIDWVSTTDRKNTSAGNGYTSIDYGTFTIFVKRFNFEWGSISGDSHAGVGSFDYPTGESNSTVYWSRSHRLSGNAPFFLVTYEGNTVYVRNITAGSVDPGTITIDMIGIKVN